jgi:outer membrane murein-binding lipoprotein Lpp
MKNIKRISFAIILAGGLVLVGNAQSRDKEKSDKEDMKEEKLKAKEEAREEKFKAKQGKEEEYKAKDEAKEEKRRAKQRKEKHKYKDHSSRLNGLERQQLTQLCLRREFA